VGFDFRSHITKPLAQTRFSFMVKGPSGVGKTRQAGFLIENGFKVLYIDSENKAATIAHLAPDIWRVKAPDFPVRKSDVMLAEQDLYRAFEFLHSADHGYDVAYWDGPMRWCEDLLEYLRRVKQLSGLDLWSAFAEKVEKAMKQFMALTSPDLPAPVHVVATWGVEMDKDWAGNRAAVPLMDGQKVKPKLNYFFDHVLYLEKLDDPVNGGSDFVMHTTGTGRFEAKVSSGTVAFPAQLKNKDANLALIIRKLQPAQPTQPTTQPQAQAQAGATVTAAAVPPGGSAQ
jgi:AAA domain-containing protein